jgi:hypothetical protein
MTSYTTASRAASQMTAFSEPQSDTTTDGTALQSNAVQDAISDAAAAPAATSGNSLLDWLGLSPNSNTSTTGLAGIMNFFSNSNENLTGAFLNNASISGISNGFTTNGMLNPTTFVDSQMTVNSLSAVGASTEGLEDLAAGLASAPALASATTALPGAAATAAVGQASLVGALSVPPTWAGSGATVSTVAATTQVGAGAYHSFGAATPMVMEEAGAVGMPGVPLAGIPGAHEDEFAEPIYGFRPRVIGRPPAAG